MNIFLRSVVEGMTFFSLIA